MSRVSAAVLVCFGFLFTGPLPGATTSDLPAPGPQYTPDEVVRIQLDALRNNDKPHPDAGIATTFAFASPRNRASTGPLQQFAKMLRAPGYVSMLNHHAAEFGLLEIDGNLALQPVILTTARGGRMGYMFELSKQTSDDCDGCWMTDGVVPFSVKEEPPHEGIML